MASEHRVSREKATVALSALLETICAGGLYADCVTAVYVFGSYARGATTVGDVDIDIEYDTKLDEAVHREVFERLMAGRDWNTPFRQALRPARVVQAMFNRLEMVAEPVLVYKRGDSVETAVDRVAAIAIDPEAGRAQRDPVHPAIEAVAEQLARPSRILLTELLTADLLTIEVVDLDDIDEAGLDDRQFIKRVRLRWRAADSPLARAARAAGAYLRASGVDLTAVALMPSGLSDDQPAEWAIDCRETRLRDLVACMGNRRICNGLFVLHPGRKRPLRALRLTASNPTALPASDIESWISEQAPQIHRIG